jgi:hypothetical protein
MEQQKYSSIYSTIQNLCYGSNPINCKYCNKLFKEIEVGVELVKAMGTFSDDSKQMICLLECSIKQEQKYGTEQDWSRKGHV